MRVVLASASPARLSTLSRAGVRPEVIVSGADEDSITAPTTAELVVALAELKGRSVLAGLNDDLLLFACDSLLEFRGQPYGKPANDADVRERWQRMRGEQGILHTGHFVARMSDGQTRELSRVASTTVSFACLTDEEIEDYIATGEPQKVAGAFTIDGFGGPFVTAIDGDHHNVVGISLPLVRTMCADLGVSWSSLWRG